ncbi:MAG: M48 family metallopeptidase [Caulobacterales bacterium]|nr:M48 family metallopeptidase [Caulobacterales bacterium]
MSVVAGALRNQREKVYGPLTVAVGAVLWPIVVLGVLAGLASGNPEVKSLIAVYLFYGVAIWLFFFISGLLYRAYAYGNMLLLSPKQFPQLHAMVVEGAQELGLRKAPHTFLYNSNGLFNAFARRILGGRYVFLTSALVDANNDEQVRFVIGHELGHHAAGHLNGWLNFLRFPAHLVPFLMGAYSRSREYTCDSVGARLSGDLDASRSALQMLGCGCRRLNASMNCEAFMAQEALVPPISGFFSEIFRTHPRLTRRVATINAALIRNERAPRIAVPVPAE